MEAKDIRKVWCMFEQSGTFKNEFIKLGIPAVDLDLQNNFNQTDYVIDLFAEIDREYDRLTDETRRDETRRAYSLPSTRVKTSLWLSFHASIFAMRKHSYFVAKPSNRKTAHYLRYAGRISAMLRSASVSLSCSSNCAI